MHNDFAADWQAIREFIDRDGFAILPRLLTGEECRDICALYDRRELFRSRIVMRRHGFGEGEYQYFQYPLPAGIQTLREEIYRELMPLANLWMERLRLEQRYPPRHDEFIRRCHVGGQRRPTPLLLRYATGDYNRLHQDLYGALWFPLQVAVLLNAPGEDFSGGEFVLTEQKPRSQSKATVVSLNQGDAVIFAVNDRPGTGSRGYYRLKMRHGVSPLRSGARHTLGIIFHDAE